MVWSFFHFHLEFDPPGFILFLMKGDQANINLTCFHEEKNGVNAARRRSAVDWSSSPVFKFMKQYISQRYTIHSAAPEGCLFSEEEEDEEGCSLPPSALPFCFYYLEKARFHFQPRSNKFKFPQKSNLSSPQRRFPSAQAARARAHAHW